MQPDGREDPARPDDGRRCDSGRVLAWAPGLTADSPTPAVEAAVPPGRDPATFGELDLALRPVSVTPPRTWRRAAWFAVGASCVVLTVLVFAASRLAGPESPFDRIDAFPGLPTGGLLTAQPPGPQQLSSERLAPTGDTANGDRVLDVPRAGDRAAEPGAAGRPEPGGLDPAPGTRPGGSPGVTTTPAGADGQTSPPAPTVTVVPTTGRPAVHADQLLTSTQQFHDALPKNVDAAWKMVGPRVRVHGFEQFRKQWGTAAQIQLKQVVVDADDSSVVTTVRFLTADGTEYTEHYRLSFRLGNTLLIEDIQVLTEHGNEPVR